MIGRGVELRTVEGPRVLEGIQRKFHIGRPKNPFKRLILMQDLGLFQQHLGLPG